MASPTAPALAPSESTAIALFESESVRGFLAQRATRRAARAHNDGGSWGAAAAEGAAGGVVVVDRDDTVGTALDLFAKHKILSAPMVLRSPADATATLPLGTSTGAAEVAPYRVLNFLSVGDIVRSFIACWEAEEHAAGAAAATGAQPPQCGEADNGYAEDARAADVGSVLWRMGVLRSAGRAFADRMCGDCGTVEDGDMVFSGASDAMPLSQLVRYGLLRWPRRRPAVAPCHRVGVFGSDGSIEEIISQSDIVEWLADNLWKLGNLVHEPVGAISGLISSPAATVSSLRPAIDAFADIERLKGVSAVGIVDAVSGALVGNFSESDLRGMRPQHFPGLALPVAEFLCYKHSWTTAPAPAAGDGPTTPGDTTPIRLSDVAASLPMMVQPSATSHTAAGAASRVPSVPWAGLVRDEYGRALLAARPVLTCSEGDSLGSVITRLAELRAHRIYCVDAVSGKPSGVISLTDVLSALVRSPTETTPAAPATI